MNINYINEITVSDFNNLRIISGWDAIEEELASNGIKNSLFKLTAKDGEKTVGIVRVIGDGGYVVLISDIMIYPEYQGRGIGRALMEKAMSYINDNIKTGQSVFVNLMAAKDKEHFYTKFGFAIRPNEKSGPGMSQWISKEAVDSKEESK